MTLPETIRRIASQPASANEETAKFQVIVPILADLGWDVHNSKGVGEVEYERPIGPGRGAKQTGRADIALMKTEGRGKGRCLCLIEAKAPSKKLDEHVDQLITYAFREGVDLCVLTNAAEWWLFLPREEGQPIDTRFAQLNLNDSPEQVAEELELFLERAALYDKSAFMRAGQRLKARKDADYLETVIPEVWREMQSLPDQELVDLLSKRVSAQAGFPPTPVQVAAVLKNQPIPQVEIPLASREASAKQVTALPEQARKVSVKPVRKLSVKPQAFSLTGERVEVRSYNEILVKLVEMLYKRHPLEFSKITSIKRGIWKQVSRDPATLYRYDPAKRLRHKPIGDTGYYIYADLTVDGIRNLCEQFLELFGYAPNDFMIFERDQQVSALSVGQQNVRPKQVTTLAGQTKRAKKVSVKPQAFSLTGERVEVSLHADVLVKLVEMLYKRHPTEFSKITSIRGKNQDYVSRNPATIRSPKLVSDTGWYVDTTLSAHSIRKRCEQFLKLFGYAPSDFVIFEQDQ